MAPELLSGRYQHNSKSDVYALGMTLFEIAFGVMPLANLTSQEIPALITGGVRPTLELDAYNGVAQPKLLPGTEPPPALIELIRMCWHAERDKRPAIDDLVDKLEAIPSDERAVRNFMLKALGRGPPRLPVSDADGASSPSNSRTQPLSTLPLVPPRVPPRMPRQPVRDDSGSTAVDSATQLPVSPSGQLLSLPFQAAAALAANGGRLSPRPVAQQERYQASQASQQEGVRRSTPSNSAINEGWLTRSTDVPPVSVHELVLSGTSSVVLSATVVSPGVVRPPPSPTTPRPQPAVTSSSMSASVQSSLRTQQATSGPQQTQQSQQSQQQELRGTQPAVGRESQPSSGQYPSYPLPQQFAQLSLVPPQSAQSVGGHVVQLSPTQ